MELLFAWNVITVEDEEEEESEEEEEWPEFHYRTVKIRDGCVDNSYVVESIQLGRYNSERKQRNITMNEYSTI